MKLSAINIDEVDEDIVSKVLFSVGCDELVEGDIIFVFGTNDDWKERMDVAVNLYKNKKAPLLFISAGALCNGRTEASVMMDYAISNGVVASDILVEEESLNTTENVLCSLLVLHRAHLLPRIRRMLVVSSPAHIRRCMLTLDKYMPQGIEFRYYHNDNSKYGKDNWLKTASSKDKLITEVKNTIGYIREGIIDDVDLTL